MTQPIITKIQNGKIVLPKELQKDWYKGDVIFTRSAGGFLAKSITPPSLVALAKRLSKAAKKARLKPKDINNAINWARK